MAAEKIDAQASLAKVESPPANTATVDDATFRRISTTMNDVIGSAQTATDYEHKMTAMQAVRLYPKAVFYSLGYVAPSQCVAASAGQQC